MATVTYNWVEVVPETLANNIYTTGNQTEPAVVALNGGTSYLAAWTHPDGTYAVEGRLYRDSGVAPNNEFNVNWTVFDDQFHPALAQLTGGNVIAAYSDNHTDPGGDILGRLFNSAGLAIDVDFGLQTSDSNDMLPEVAALADGGFALTWVRDFGGGDLDVDAAVYSADGSVRASFIPVNIDSALSTTNADVAGLANGNFVVTWQQAGLNGAGPSSAWFGVYSPTGTTVSGSVLIDNFGSSNFDVQVAALPDGAFAVAYSDNGWGISGLEITVKIFEANGAERTGFLLANTQAGGDQYSPSLTVLSNGFLLVGWYDRAVQSIKYQAFDPNGNRAGSEYSIQSDGEYLALAGLSGGLVASVVESVIHDSGLSTSIRTSIDEISRTTAGNGTGEVLVGDSLRDTIRGGAGNDNLYGHGNDDNLIGGDDNDLLVGGDGNDRLEGGIGNDSLYGEGGDDVYIVGDRFDYVFEAAGEGTDIVKSSVSYTLFSNFERLELTGIAAIDGTGNDLDNILYGNGAANTLFGGNGADQMRGGGGSDTYGVDNAGDRVIEAAGAGTDLVRSAISCSLPVNTENLTLTGSRGSAGTGNKQANVIVGNSGANALQGLGGNDTLSGGGGNDTLTGGTGADQYLFDAALSASSNHDSVTDFSVADDTIALDRSIFTAFAAAGAMSSSAFFAGAAAHDANDRIIYNSTTGDLYYDPDGTGAAAQVLFAHVAAGLAITAADFVMVT